MGRFCTFSNEIIYKFSYGYQPSGFGFLEKTGAVESNKKHVYQTDSSLLHKNLCKVKCDKELKDPDVMLVVDEGIFCDEECHEKFMSTCKPELSISTPKTKSNYRLLTWLKDNKIEIGERFHKEDMKGEFDIEWIEYGYIYFLGKIDFSLKVNQNKLLEYIVDTGYSVPNWESYSLDTLGSASLLTEIPMSCYYFYESSNFRLACLIYHMSLYESVISGSYDI